MYFALDSPSLVPFIFQCRVFKGRDGHPAVSPQLQPGLCCGGVSWGKRKAWPKGGETCSREVPPGRRITVADSECRPLGWHVGRDQPRSVHAQMFGIESNNRASCQSVVACLLQHEQIVNVAAVRVDGAYRSVFEDSSFWGFRY